jgi:hypothetical protein
MRFHEGDGDGEEPQKDPNSLKTINLPSQEIIPEEDAKSSVNLGSMYLKDDDESFVDFK